MTCLAFLNIVVALALAGCARGALCNTPCVEPGPCQNPGVCDPVDGVCKSVTIRFNAACNDGDPNTVNDFCQSETCIGGQSCVTSLCTSEECKSPGTCDALTGLCGPQKALPDGTPCNDQVPYTLNDTCRGGRCIGVSRCEGVQCLAPQCGVAGRCLVATGVCTLFTPGADGIPCDDGSAATANDTCTAGQCTGVPVVIPTPKTNMTCQGAGDGLPCVLIDGGSGVCQLGACVSPVSPIVNTPARCIQQCLNRPCLVASCNNITAVCDYSPTDEGSVCSTGRICISGVCSLPTANLSKTCGNGIVDEGEQCDGPIPESLMNCSSLGFRAGKLLCSAICRYWTSSCGGMLGCNGMSDGTRCDDNDPSTDSDACVKGVCKGTVLCQTANSSACYIADQCDKSLGISRTFTLLSDGTLCDIFGTNSVCVSGRCGRSQEYQCDAASCKSSRGQCYKSSCNTLDGKCIINIPSSESTCDDGNTLTFGDVCLAGRCVGAFKCSSDGDCLKSNTCIERVFCSFGLCRTVLKQDYTPCNDGDPATVEDTCYSGQCIDGRMATVAAFSNYPSLYSVRQATGPPVAVPCGIVFCKDLKCVNLSFVKENDGCCLRCSCPSPPGGSECSGHGTCDGVNGICICEASFCGADCSRSGDCTSLQCVPTFTWGPACGGRCIGLTTGTDSTNNTSSVICSGHGVCDAGKIGSGRCLCQPEWMGDTCSQPYSITPCQYYSCSNGFRCRQRDVQCTKPPCTPMAECVRNPDIPLSLNVSCTNTCPYVDICSVGTCKGEVCQYRNIQSALTIIVVGNGSVALQNSQVSCLGTAKASTEITSSCTLLQPCGVDNTLVSSGKVMWWENVACLGEVCRSNLLRTIVGSQNTTYLVRFEPSLSDQSKCGDALITGTEICEPNNLGQRTCGTVAGQNFHFGILRCLPDCNSFDTSQCNSASSIVVGGNKDPLYVGGKIKVAKGLQSYYASSLLSRQLFIDAIRSDVAAMAGVDVRLVQVIHIPPSGYEIQFILEASSPSAARDIQYALVTLIPEANSRFVRSGYVMTRFLNASKYEIDVLNSQIFNPRGSYAEVIQKDFTLQPIILIDNQVIDKPSKWRIALIITVSLLGVIAVGLAVRVLLKVRRERWFKQFVTEDKNNISLQVPRGMQYGTPQYQQMNDSPGKRSPLFESPLAREDTRVQDTGKKSEESKLQDTMKKETIPRDTAPVHVASLLNVDSLRDSDKFKDEDGASSGSIKVNSDDIFDASEH